MKKYKTALIVILLFIIQTLLHYAIASQYNLAKSDFYKIYGFLFIITLLVILLIEFANMAFKEQLGFVFLAIIAFKFVAALLFIKMAQLNIEPQKYHFLIAYLLLIFLLTIFVAQKLLNTDKKH